MAVTLSVAARGKIIISFPGYKVIHRPNMRAVKKPVHFMKKWIAFPWSARAF
jgi:hypothetical protein